MAFVWGFTWIFILRVFGISLATLQTLMMVQGRRALAMISGIISALVYVLAIGKVVNNMDNGWYIASYCLGFGAGTWLGMVIDARLAMGFADVRIISAESGPAIADHVRAAGYGATTIVGQGRDRQVVIVETIAPRKAVNTILAAVTKVDPQAVVAVADARQVKQGYWRLPTMTQR
ncbi:MAG: DUF5698 domain-containing protein [Chloroflexi bacterium]|nr:DUF5698 domain-containing protein [Chloroflexota bacterium]